MSEPDTEKRDARNKLWGRILIVALGLLAAVYAGLMFRHL